MAVDRAGFTPEPSTANHFPTLERTAKQIVGREGWVPPNQASTQGASVGIQQAWNQGLQVGG